MEQKKYRVGPKAAVMAPKGRLTGGARLLAPGASVPDNVFSRRKLAEHLEAGSIVEVDAEPEVDESVPPVIRTADKDGFMEPVEIEGGDTKLADLKAKQEAAKLLAEAEGRPSTTEDALDAAKKTADEKAAAEAKEAVKEAIDANIVAAKEAADKKAAEDEPDEEGAKLLAEAEGRDTSAEQVTPDSAVETKEAMTDDSAKAEDQESPKADSEDQVEPVAGAAESSDESTEEPEAGGPDLDDLG